MEALGIGAGARLGAGKVVGSEMTAGARKLIGKVDAKTARNVAELLTSNDPKRLARGLGIAMRNQKIMDGLKLTANALSVSAATPTGREAAIAAAPGIRTAFGASASPQPSRGDTAATFDPSQPYETYGNAPATDAAETDRDTADERLLAVGRARTRSQRLFQFHPDT
jgi:hypothetical protein